MELNEAIKHCEETALSCAKGNRACALEHVQLMQWLKELRALRQIVRPEYLQEIRGLQKTWGKEWEEYFNRALCYDVSGPFRDKNKEDVETYFRNLGNLRNLWKEDEVHHILNSQTMTLNEYQKAALTTAVYPREYKAIYPALGMAGEAGEVADKVKKIIRDTQITRNEQGAINIEPQKATEIAKEVGDVLWYCATLAHDLGYSLEKIAQMNIEKLQSRKARGVIGGSGDNR